MLQHVFWTEITLLVVFIDGFHITKKTGQSSFLESETSKTGTVPGKTGQLAGMHWPIYMSTCHTFVNSFMTWLRNGLFIFFSIHLCYRPFQMRAWSCISSYPLRGLPYLAYDNVNPAMVNSMMLHSSMLAFEKVYSPATSAKLGSTFCLRSQPETISWTTFDFFALASS